MHCQHYLIILCVLYFKPQHTLSDTTDKLKLVHIIFRHGERAPTETYKNDPHRTWPEGWGQLTNRGKKQMYSLGLTLRENYKDFLPKYYFPEDVYVMSSYADRNLMSAQLVLAGIYPPVDEQIWNAKLLWQPIPVKYLPRSLDNIIALKRYCAVYEKALNAAYNSERVQHINIDNKDLYKYISDHTGEEIHNISKLESLYNTLEIEMQHNLQLPEWTNNLSMQNLRALAAENLAIFTDTRLMQRLKGGVLLKEVANRMSQKSQNNLKPDLNLILYAAHDLTIVSVMRTLGFEELLKPDYGASLIFELYEVGNGHEIRLLYKPDWNQNAEHLKMKRCPTPCLLADFIEAYQNVIPVNWEQECIDENTIIDI